MSTRIQTNAPPLSWLEAHSAENGISCAELRLREQEAEEAMRPKPKPQAGVDWRELYAGHLSSALRKIAEGFGNPAIQTRRDD